MEASRALAGALGTRDRSERKLTGTVTRLWCARDGFSAGVIRVDDGPLWDRDCRFSARALVRIDEEITLTGAWKENAQYGWQFVAESVTYPMPDVGDAAGLAEYLAQSPAFRGIGPVKAQLIADTFGAAFDEVLREHPERIAAAAKISTATVEELRAAWTERADTNAISQWLASYGLTHTQVRRIADQYGNRAQQVLTENPYILAEEVHNIGFGRADEIAQKMGTPKTHPGRIRAYLVHAVRQEAEQAGHTWISRLDLIKNAVSKLALDDLSSEKLVREHLTALCHVDDFGVAGDLIAVEDPDTHQVRIALRRLYEQEQALGHWVRGAADIRPTFYDKQIPELIARVADEHFEQPPSETQAAAVTMALRNQVSIISGGAGTGKSRTIALIYHLFTDAGHEVALCAPTGKAAKRMSQLAGGAHASTIHRLLAYQFDADGSGGFLYGEGNKLPHDLVIVDEVSMCDVRLLWHLFSAVDLSRTQVLLVGDHNQLPPIGPGNFLRDALETHLVPHTILDICFRAGGELKSNCNALLHGAVRKSTPADITTGAREWHLIDDRDDPEAVVELLRLLMGRYWQAWGYDPIDECQIITPYNKGPLGVNRLNLELQRLWQKKTYGVDLPTVEAPGWDRRAPAWHIGDKVIQTKNDYKFGSGVMNGTGGVVKEIQKLHSGKMIYTITFDDCGSVDITAGSDQEKNVTLAYAITIHKAQGSEWPCVVAVIHKAHTYMLSRNLIYTAATRARRSAILIGDKLGMRRAARTITTLERRTWLSLSKTSGGND